MYVRDEQASLQRPEKELKGFAKVQLDPGERKTAALSLASDALAYYDDLAHEWVAEAGAFEVLVARRAIPGKPESPTHRLHHSIPTPFLRTGAYCRLSTCAG